MIFPLFEAFPLDHTIFKDTSDLNLPIVDLLDSLALNLILKPHAIIFLVISDLFIPTLAMELPIKEIANKNAAIRKVFLPLAIRVILREISRVHRAIRITQTASTFLDAVPPLALVLCSVLPLTDAVPIHFALLPLASVGPAPLLALEGALAILVSIFEVSIV